MKKKLNQVFLDIVILLSLHIKPAVTQLKTHQNIPGLIFSFYGCIKNTLPCPEDKHISK